MIKGNDTLRIHITNKHYLNAEGQSSGFRITRQQFLTADSLLFREINFDETTGKISNYVFLFYRDNKLFTEECYNAKDTLLYIIKHEYDAKGNEKLTQKLSPVGGKLVVMEKTQRKFNQHNSPVSIKKYYGKIAGTTVNFGYDDVGNILTETIKNKSGAKAPFKEETRMYSHNDDLKIKQIQIAGIDNTGSSYSYSEAYSYTNEGLLSSIKSYNTDGTIQLEKVYGYLKSGAPSTYEELNNKGIVILKLLYEYRKHYMNKGNQVSYYENL
jgi:hypothetical protein